MALPLDVRDLMSSGAKLREERERPLRVAVLVDAEAPQSAVDALKEALRPQMSSARLHVEAVVPGDILVIDPLADVVVALAGPADTLAPSLARARDSFIPTVLLVLGEHRDGAAKRLGQPLLDTFAHENASELVASLGHWLADRMESKRVALAANFAFVRRAVAEESVKNTAFQNAIIGGVAVIPGADMPLMTANQAKMVLQIAAAYGQPLDTQRVKELTAVVGGAFVFRTVARQALAFVPGFGWAIKAGIGYSGTLAMGYAAIEYFEGGGDVSGLAEKLRETRAKVTDAASRLRHREPPITAYATVVETQEPDQSRGAASLPPVSGVTPADVIDPSQETARS